MKNIKEKTIYQMMKSCALNYMDNYALICLDRDVNYTELFDNAFKLAETYQAMGLKGKKIDLYPKISYKWIIVFLGLTMAGAIVVLHDPFLSIDKLIEDIEMKGTAEDFYDIDRKYLSEFVYPDEDDTALIIFTSGTGGKSKGVQISHKNLVSDAILAGNQIGENAVGIGDKTIPVLPLFHLFGITASIISPLLMGMVLYIIEDIKYLTKSLQTIRPRILFVVPIIVKTLLSRAQILENKGKSPESIHQEFFGGLRMLVCGGAPLNKDLIVMSEKYNIQLLNGYGITECSPIVTTSQFNNFVYGSVGRVDNLVNAEVRIIDESIHVSGDIVMKGYVNDELYPFKLIDNKLWYDTQDYGFIDDSGNLFIIGRKSNLIILDDGNITSPEEIEICFDSYDLIKDILVFESDHNGVQTITAAIYPDYNKLCNWTTIEIKKKIDIIVEEVNKSLPLYKRIGDWYVRQKDFKRTSLNKVIRTKENYFD